MDNRFTVVPAVFIALVKDGEVILQKRQNTGFMDGYYDLPSGHIEPGETPPTAGAREAKEEVDIDIKETDLKLFHVSISTLAKPYIYFFFKVQKWTGNPQLADKERISEVAYFGLDQLPTNTVPHVKVALKDLDKKEVTFAFLTSGDK
ncbi:MAG TPA: NUDIX domain-containing protein [Candidatus Saccharimonadales bacterium]|nr:NUDIX domain-containing protein [Candidatus Saccharimonadales bacterium]